jgi:hypothetical protein
MLTFEVILSIGRPYIEYVLRNLVCNTGLRSDRSGRRLRVHSLLSKERLRRMPLDWPNTRIWRVSYIVHYISIPTYSKCLSRPHTLLSDRVRTKGRDSQTAVRGTNLQGALRCYWNNRKYGAGKPRFPNKKQYSRVLKNVPPALWNTERD